MSVETSGVCVFCAPAVTVCAETSAQLLMRASLEETLPVTQTTFNDSAAIESRVVAFEVKWR